ncbi:hypothetical protein K7X08_014935 [Anisodus acutangulus]|uniref:Uncharacterized protein n=1 Tax=Anisodus acutangulus TaxID=402998 RepID=A0A9Q1LL68_9SOLA|nr:hypothetical protein K7X08_014935 [Anisodus acutangulus]
MATNHASSSATRGAGQGTTRSGNQDRTHQTRPHTRTQATPPPEVVNVNMDVVTRLLNVLEVLVHNQGGLPAAQATSQAQVQLSVRATSLAP